MTLRLGVDIGGTKTRAVAVDADGHEVADVQVGSASLQTVGAEGAASAAGDLVTALGEHAGQIGAIGIGSAGVDTPELAEELAAIFRARFEGVPVTVVHDTRLLLMTGELEAGCVLIVGTGSAAWAINPDGQDARVGGWGWLLGDEGSAFGVVKGALRAALSDLDHARETSRLTQELVAAVKVDRPIDLLREVYERPSSRLWGGLAPAVVNALRAGCPRARTVVDATLDAAAHEAILACSRVGIQGPVLLAGGFVTHVEEVADGVRSRLEAAGLRDISVLRRDPVWGAVALAESMVAGGVDA